MVMVTALIVGFACPVQSATVAAVTTLLKEKCTDCHNPLGPIRRGPSGGLDLETNPLADLINIRAEEDEAEKVGMMRVLPNKPLESLLYLKLSATTEEFTYGDAMPSPERDQPWVPLPAAEIELIRTWIAAGAPLTGEFATTAIMRGSAKGSLRLPSGTLSLHGFRPDGRNVSRTPSRPELPQQQHR
jgi:hypothetical protein